jgi:maltooligosyltrehalose trehalohydrolase
VKPLRVWAPTASRVEVEVRGARRPMAQEPGGWWSAGDDSPRPGDDYAIALDGGRALPDPRSPWQPHGVHGPSRAVDHDAFPWQHRSFRAPPLASAAIYELHVGTFTPAGTFDGAIERLDHLVDLGISHVELMPVAAFPGTRGWGYDGVDLFAPQHAYGGPDGLKRFVDACHGRGLAVLLDVVYNHLGPSGNYLSQFGPYFTERYRTPWGPAVNFDDRGSDEVRRFVIDDALSWLRDYRIDGLRLDAVHAIFDASATHILEELAGEVEALATRLERPLVLIAESDLNDPRLVRSREAGGYGMDAQWSDDFHHALHVALTGERDGYYADFHGLHDVATALERVFVYAGRHAPHRGRRHGRSPVGLPASRFVGFLQNHDQIGNRAQGDRMSQLVSVRRLHVGAALVLTAPFVPMLFQGEEWGASSPFLYFTDHDDPDLARAVSEGRRREFAAFDWRPEDAPDPQDPQSFARSRLDWAELTREPHAGLLDWHRRLLALRRRSPDLRAGRAGRVCTRCDERAGWLSMERGEIAVACNLGASVQTIPIGGRDRLLLASDPAAAVRDGGVELPPESVAVCAPGWSG